MYRYIQNRMKTDMDNSDVRSLNMLYTCLCNLQVGFDSRLGSFVGFGTQGFSRFPENPRLAIRRCFSLGMAVVSRTLQTNRKNPRAKLPIWQTSQVLLPCLNLSNRWLTCDNSVKKKASDPIRMQPKDQRKGRCAKLTNC